MEVDFELTNKIVNGYWYIFDYDSSSKEIGYDQQPLVFCIEPSQKNINVFVGLNLHHFPESARKEIYMKMVTASGFNKNEERHLLSLDTILNLINYTHLGIRHYNRKNIRNAYRIKNKELGKYLSFEGNLLMSKPSAKDIEFNLNASK